MSIYRSYFTAQAGIIAGSLNNASRNEVIDMSYGKVIANYMPSGDTVYTRYVFSLDFQEIERYRSKHALPAPNRHVLRMYNTISVMEGFRGELMLDDSRRAYGFTLEIYRLTQPFVEGIGHDYRYPNTQSIEVTRQLNEQNDESPNWYWASPTAGWATEGSIDRNTAILVASQDFPLGTENLEVDFTDEVNEFLSNPFPNYGYCLAFSEIIELNEDDRLNKVHFFSRHTQTWFEPHIESYFNDSITDEADVPNSILLDRDSYAIIKSDCYPTEATLYDHCGIQLSGYTNFEPFGNGYYKVYLGVFPSSAYPPLVNFDFEYSCTGSKPCRFYMTTFDAECNDYSSESNDEYAISIPNLGYGASLAQGMSLKMKVNVRSFLKSRKYVPLEYRIYIKQGRNIIDVQGWEKVSRVGMEYFFWLRTSWMLPHEYWIEIRPRTSSEDYGNGYHHKFFVESKKIDGYR